MIPFILLGAALVAGGVGVAAGVEAADNYKKAKKIANRSERRLNKAKSKLGSKRKKLRDSVEELGCVYITAVEVLEEFAKYMNRLGSSVRNLPKKDTSNLRNLEDSIAQYRHALNKLSLEGEVEKAVGIAAVEGILSGLGSYGGAVAIGTAIGTASTGTAISTLSGAAFSNALLAWFGGGALAAGGGGMALGTLVLGGIAAGPALGIGGIVLAEKTEKMLTEAKEFEGKVEEVVSKIYIEIEELETMIAKIKERTGEVEYYTDELKSKLYELRAQRSPSKPKVLTLIAMARTLKNILDAPVLNMAEGIG